MMINKRLIGTVSESKKYIAANVVLQWCSLLANISMIFAISQLLQKLLTQTLGATTIIATTAIILVSILIRFVCTTGAAKMSYFSSKSVKKILRQKIYQKLLKLGGSYTDKISTSEVVQMSVEGVDQLETYFGAYLPQFFYSMLAPVTLFAVLSVISLKAAIVLLICVPLIPVAIAAVQTFAKKLLSKYWGQYTALGDTFLENLQGLTTLKIYQSDDFKNQEMNREAEKFRKITMKVLTMQLNSITIMDLVAYGGAALGVIISVNEFQADAISFMGCFAIILLSADFFLPMRQLGSFFHIAMNGMAASDKIFRLLDLPDPEPKTATVSSDHYAIQCKDLRFSYNEGREILHGVHMEFPMGGFISLVGESGCGKSTIASLLMGRNQGYTGSITIGGIELSQIAESSLIRTITYISHNSYLLKGTVRDNLLMGNPNATDQQLWAVLEQTNLADFLRQENGLDTLLQEKASNLSGGQCQRLALARALLHDTPIYIFDEATSNIDVESENDIIEQIHQLAKTKTVLLISHRLANVVASDCIYVLEKGNLVESGTHQQLLEKQNVYAHLWECQQSLEHYQKGGEIR
ncbi:ABC transporter ATP-binding protein/permease [Clostridium sp. NSJ-27]|uniref:ABC transporter ATP-binding protein/permease n=2 Tax=Clostridium facile TaxID=2763035 RepID=A0ABR7IQ17_9CLOT|nr:ABC transporter ATP-binding protein/permease [Clostridium facile]MBC5787154.1 ABC transporter ATP-binding protein/permease [Clostridium facile]